MARRLVPLAQSFGLEGSALCARAGIAPQTLEDPEGRVRLAASLDVLDAVAQRSSAAIVGLRLATTAEPDVYHTPALILLASDSLAAGFERAFRYQRLWGDGERFALVPALAVGRAESGTAVTFRIPEPRRPAVTVLEVCALAETVLAVRFLCGRVTEAPLGIGFPEVDDASGELERFFGVPPTVGAEAAFALFSHEVLNAPQPHANALFLSIFEQQASTELARLPPSGDLPATVRAHAMRALARGRFSLSDCAQSLGMTTRTLERRLADHGTTYAEVLEATRRDQAMRWLGERRSIEEVSLLLGYSERSAFHRACLRWFGKTPGELRAELGRRA